MVKLLIPLDILMRALVREPRYVYLPLSLVLSILLLLACTAFHVIYIEGAGCLQSGGKMQRLFTKICISGRNVSNYYLNFMPVS